MSSQRGFSLTIILVLLSIFVGLIAMGIGNFKENFLSQFQKASPIIVNQIPNQNLSLLFFTARGPLVGGFNSIQTYLSDLTLANKTPVNINLTLNDLGNRSVKYQTSVDGKYIFHSTKNYIEVALNTNPQSFTKIFNSSEGDIGNFFITKDDAKIIIETIANNPAHSRIFSYQIIVQSMTNPNDRIVVKPYQDGDPERSNDQNTSLYAYDSVKNQLYWQVGGGDPFGGDEKRVTIDNNGKLVKTENIPTYHQSIAEFDPDFHYAYYMDYQTYKPSDPNGKQFVIQQDLVTGKKNQLVEFTYKAGEPFSILNLKLSPINDKLFFLARATNSGSNNLYVVNLQTKKAESFFVASSLVPEQINYVSPDGKFLIFQIGLDCHSSCNNWNHVGEEILFDVENKKFYKLYSPIGNKVMTSNEAQQLKSANDIENFGFIGWLATPGTSSIEVNSLPEVTFPEP